MKVHIAYPELRNDVDGALVGETLDAEPVGEGLAEIRRHSPYIPLAPGDVVTHADGLVTGVAQFTPTWTIEAEFAIPVDLVAGEVLPTHVELKISETLAMWNREAYCTRTTGLYALVSASTKEWLQDRVMGSPYVAYNELVRWPDMAMDYDVMLRNATWDGLANTTWS